MKHKSGPVAPLKIFLLAPSTSLEKNPKRGVPLETKQKLQCFREIGGGYYGDRFETFGWIPG
jgi:hypothetical protein